MQSTTNYGLNKPEGADIYNVDDFNENADIIDAELKKSADHINDKGNPHGVTKADVGLGNVDNTSDMDKPVSTEQNKKLNRYMHNLVNEWKTKRWEKGQLVCGEGSVYRCIEGVVTVMPWGTNHEQYWEEVVMSEVLYEHQQKLDVIGSISTITGEKISVQSNGSASTAVAEATFNKGIYLVVCSVNFPGGNTTGSRRINLLTTPNTISATPGVTSSCVPLSGITQSLQITTILNVTTDGTTYYLNAQQTSGSTLDDCQGQIRAVRIA